MRSARSAPFLQLSAGRAQGSSWAAPALEEQLTSAEQPSEPGAAKALAVA